MMRHNYLRFSGPELLEHLYIFKYVVGEKKITAGILLIPFTAARAARLRCTG